MKRFLMAILVVAFVAVRVAAEQPATAPRIDVLFSPGGGCTERIIDEIKKATKTVQVQAYSFTSAPIAKVILGAKKRGVLCQVILDASQETQSYSELDFFHNQGIPTWIDDRHAIAHNKIIIIDGDTIITGSFNFSKAAEERNAENVLVISGNDDLARKYLSNFGLHLSHSRTYEGRSQPTRQPRAPPVVEQPRKSTPDDSSDVTVYVTRTGKKYHRGSCNYLRKSKTPMKLSEAKARYGPCSRCRPPS